MNLHKKKDAFVRLGKFLKQFDSIHGKSPEERVLNEQFYDRFQALITTAYQYNGWFTEENVMKSVAAIAQMLEKEKLEKWLNTYEAGLTNTTSAKRVGVIMAGNIPMVGFHDMLCVLMSGNVFVGKTSSDDPHLLPALAEVLNFIEPEFKDCMVFTNAQLKDIDAVIATGSNNSARYFEYYFGKYPHIIRRNRNSIALLDGTETEEDLKSLGNDIFQYFGLGCRNVSKILVPLAYNFDNFFKAIFDFQFVVNNNKYGNNYDYNKTVYLMSNVQLLENGFLLLKEDTGLSSPIATLFYEYYTNEQDLMARIQADSPRIQCIVSKRSTIKGCVGFGKSQHPELWDYADGVDTMRFLIEVGKG